MKQCVMFLAEKSNVDDGSCAESFWVYPNMNDCRLLTPKCLAPCRPLCPEVPDSISPLNAFFFRDSKAFPVDGRPHVLFPSSSQGRASAVERATSAGPWRVDTQLEEIKGSSGGVGVYF